MFSLVKNMFVYGLGQMLSKTVGLLLLPFLTAYLTPHDYGVQSMINFMLLFLSPLVTLGIASSFGLCFHEERTKAQEQKTVGSSLILLCTSGGIISLLGALCATPISSFLFSGEDYSLLIQLSFLSFFLSVLVVPFQHYLQYSERHKAFSTLNTLAAVIVIICNCMLIIGFRWGVYGLIVAPLIGNAIQLVLFMAVCMPALKRLEVDFSVMRRLGSVGFPMVLGFFLLFIQQNSWRYFMEADRSLEELGIFTIGFNFGMVAFLIVQAFVNVWFPYFLPFADKLEEAKRAFKKINTYFYVGAGSLTLLVFFFSKGMFTLVTQPAYHSAYDIIGWIFMGFLLSGAFNLYLPGVYFAKRVYLSLIPQVLACAWTMALSILLTKEFGKWGVTIAFCSSYAVMGTAMITLNRVYGLFQAEHNWRILTPYLVLFTLFLGLSLIPRTLTLPEEFGMSLALTLAYAALLYPLCIRTLLKTPAGPLVAQE